MHKILIVDDEITVRKGLLNLIEWEEHGFDLVDTAEDAREALQKYKNTLHDIVITDICLNQDNGLDLLSQIHAINPATEVIILTGYPNFEYAKSAINNNAAAYLLKPLNTAELLDVLSKIQNKIRKQERSAYEHFLSDLLLLEAPDENAISYLSSKYNISVPKEPFFVVNLQIDSKNQKNNPEFINYIADRICAGAFDSKNYICHSKSNCVTALLFVTNSMSLNYASRLFEEIQSDFLQKYNLSLTVGISKSFDKLTSILEANLQSMFAVSQRTLRGYGKIIYYTGNSEKIDSHTLSTNLLLNFSDISDILNNIRAFDKENVYKYIDKLFEKFNELDDINIDFLKSIIAEFALQIMYSVAKNHTQMNIIFGDIPRPLIAVGKMDLLPEMKEYIIRIIDAIFARPEIYIKKGYSKTTEECIQYILQHYQFQVTIEKIAEHLYIEKGHLMKTFKQETGMTINQYLTKLRIDIAINYLSSGNYRIKDIALLTGFQATNYFTKVFKKVTGKNPTQYMNVSSEKDQA